MSRLDEIRARARQKALEEEQANEEAEAKKAAVGGLSSRTRKTGKLDELWGSKTAVAAVPEASTSKSRGTSTQSQVSHGKARSIIMEDEDEDEKDDDDLMLDEDLVALSKSVSAKRAQPNVKAGTRAPKSSQAIPPSSSTLSEPPSTMSSRAGLKRTRSQSTDKIEEEDDDVDHDLPGPSTFASSSRAGRSALDSPVARPRRSAARVAPYSYSVSLERPSETRQALLDAKHSAGVKMNIIKHEDYKTHSGRSNDFLGQLLREQKRDERLGITSAGYQHTLDLLKKSGFGPAESDEMDHDEGDDSDGELSVLTKLSNAETEEQLRAMRLRVDRETELHYWNRAKHVVDREMALPRADGSANASSTKGRQSASFKSLCKKARNATKGGKILMPDKDVFLAWVVDVVLTATSPFDAQAAFDLLQKELEKKHTNTDTMQLCQALHTAIVCLGVTKRYTQLADSQGPEQAKEAPTEKDGNMKEVEAKPSDATIVLQGLRRAESILRITSLIANSMISKNEDVDDCHLSLFVQTLVLLNDPRHLQARAEGFFTMEILFDAIARKEDMLPRLARRVHSVLVSLSSSTHVAILSSMPTHCVEARVLQRTVALRLLLRKDVTDVTDVTDEVKLDAWTDLSAIKDMLSSEDVGINPFQHEQHKPRDFDEMEARARILTYSLSDLAVQIVEVRREDSQLIKERHKAALLLHWQAGLDKFLPASDAHARQFSYSAKSDLPFGTSRDRVATVKSIARLLEQLNASIVEGLSGATSGSEKYRDHTDGDDVDVADLGLVRPPRSAGLSRSRAKTALQRTSLSLLYGLQLLGYHSIDRLSEGKGQQRLTAFFEPK